MSSSLFEALSTCIALAPELTLLCAAIFLALLGRAMGAGGALPRAAIAFVVIVAAAMASGAYVWIDAEFIVRPGNPLFVEFLALLGMSVGALWLFRSRSATWRRQGVDFVLVVAAAMALWQSVRDPLAFDAGIVRRQLLGAPDGSSSLLRVDAFAAFLRVLLAVSLFTALVIRMRRAAAAAADEMGEACDEHAELAKAASRAALLLFAHASASLVLLTENMLVAGLGFEAAILACMRGQSLWSIQRLPSSILIALGAATIFAISGAEGFLFGFSFDQIGYGLEEVEFDEGTRRLSWAAWIAFVLGLAGKASLVPLVTERRGSLDAPQCELRWAMTITLRVAVIAFLLRVAMAMTGAWSWTPSLAQVFLVFAVVTCVSASLAALRAQDASTLLSRASIALFGFALSGLASFYLFELDEDTGEIVSSFASEDAVGACLIALAALMLWLPIAKDPGAWLLRSTRVGHALAHLSLFTPASLGFFASFELQRASFADARAIHLAVALLVCQLLFAFVVLRLWRIEAANDWNAGDRDASAPIAGARSLAVRRAWLLACAGSAVALACMPSTLRELARAAALGLRL